MVINKLSKVLKKWIKSQGVKQKWLAEKLGVSESMLSNFLAGRRKLSLETLGQLQKITGIEIFN